MSRKFSAFVVPRGGGKKEKKTIKASGVRRRKSISRQFLMDFKFRFRWKPFRDATNRRCALDCAELISRIYFRSAHCQVRREGEENRQMSGSNKKKLKLFSFINWSAISVRSLHNQLGIRVSANFSN